MTPPVRSPALATVAFALALLAVCPAGVTAQSWRTSSDVRLAAANGLVGGVTVVVQRALGNEGDLWSGFFEGFLGGAVSFTGRRVIATDVPGSELLGRQIGAVGNSVIHNSARGEAIWSTLALPLGPVNLYVSFDDPEGNRFRFRGRFNDIAWTAWALADPEMRVDWARSLRVGFMVIEKSRNRLDFTSLGMTVGGAALFDDSSDWVLEHEAIHVAEFDFLNTVFGYPVERALFGTKGMARHLDFGVVVPATLGLGILVGGDGFGDLLEFEVDRLTGSSR